MIEFTNIVIEGFCSIQEFNLPLNSSGITVIRGTNGQGKTSLFNALVWGLYGKNLKGTSDVNTWAKIRPKKYNGTMVQVYFKSSDHIYCVTRCLKYTKEVLGARGNSRLIYQVDGDIIDEKGKRNIQDIINHDLGMSYNLFINSVMFGQGLKRLIQETGSSQREIFEEVFELGYLTKAKKIAQDKYSRSESECQSLVRDIEHVSSSIAAFKENLNLTKERMKRYDNDKKEIEKRNAEEKEKLELLLEDNKKKLIKMKPEKVEAKHQMINKALNLERRNLDDAREATGIPLEELINEIVELLKKKKYDSSLSKLLTLQKAFKTQEESKEKIYKLREEQNALNDQEWKIRELKKSINNIKANLEKLEKNKSEVSSPDFESILNNLKDKLKKAKNQLKQYKELYKVHGESRDLYKWAYTDPLGNTGIKSYLFESSLNQLNDILETYSDIIGFSITFQVDLTTARKDFKTIISFEGQQVSYDELSGGQKQLANLAMAFSMNALVAQAQGTNIAFLDEVFESLSEDNIEIVISLIKKIYHDKTLFLITHQESLPISNARVLRVKSIKGISQYEW